MTTIEEGETLVYGLDRHNAASLLAAAERCGLAPEVVRTSGDGFVVPNEVADLAFPVSSEPFDESSIPPVKEG